MEKEPHGTESAEEKPVLVETIVWKGVEHTLELYASDELPDGPVSQVQCVAFTSGGQVVLYKHIDGYVGLPGGTVEGGESIEDSLHREVDEETAAKITKSGQIAYLKDTNEETGEHTFQVRYWAEVDLLDTNVADPDGKALERVVVDPTQVVELLGDGWGDRGAVLLELAIQAKKSVED